MTGPELRRGFERLLADEPPPTSTATVLHRARAAHRRRSRLRVASAAAVAVAALASVLAVAGPPDTPAVVTAVGGWFSDSEDASAPTQQRIARAYKEWSRGPARGPRAGDEALHRAALAAWAARTDLDELAEGWSRIADRPVGDPRVAWAGDVLGDPVVLIHQRADVTPREAPGLDEGVEARSDLWISVSVPGVRPAHLTSIHVAQSQEPPHAGVLGFWTNRTAGRALILDLGTDLVYSPGVRPTGGGGYTRDLVPLVFDESIATIDVGPDVTLGGVKFGPPGPLSLDRYALSSGGHALGTGDLDETAIAGLQPPTLTPLDLENAFWAQPEPPNSDLDNGSAGSGSWFVAGNFPDGTKIAFGPRVIDDASRLVLLIRDSDGNRVIDAGPEPRSGRPVTVRLPEGRGWIVVAADAALRYRTDASGRWKPAGADAALLPDAAVAVEVSSNGSRDAVDLAR